MTATASPAPSVLAGLRQALVAHLPFSAMEEAHVELVVRATTVRYFAPGDTIVARNQAAPESAFFIRQGSVQRRPVEGAPSADGIAWEKTAGEMFPLAELLGHRGATQPYVALDDVFVLSFPASVFDALLAQSHVFADFCTRTLSHLLHRVRAALQAEYAAALTEQRGAGAPLGQLVRQPAVTVERTLPIGEALAMMEASRIGTVPIVDAARRPLGIFTRQDVVGRVVLPKRPLSTPIGEIMSAPVVTLPTSASAADAAFEMTAHGIRHVVLVDDGGTVSGVVSERDLFGLQRLSVRELASDIRRASDIAALRRLAADVRAMASVLVAQGLGSGHLTRMIASLNDQVLHRLLDLVRVRHAIDGVTMCWIGMGSEGRREQTIATDQDNGLIFVARAEETDGVRAKLLPFAREVNLALDSLGYPLCKGGVMAMNPQWCASLVEWQQAFGRWIEQGDPQSLLVANIFFDFRPLWGDASLAHELRNGVAARARVNSRFLKQMADNALRSRPALNWLGELQADAGTSGIDVKHRGTALFVDGARIFALAAGILTTNTVERFNEAAPLRGIPVNEVRAWSDAYDFLQLLRLRTQHRRSTGALPPSSDPNVVPLDDLSSLDRRMLKESFRQVRMLQQRLALDYPG